MTRRSLFRSIAGAFVGSVLAKTALAGPEVKPMPLPRWHNWDRTYRIISKEEMIEKMRTAMAKTKFNPPTEDHTKCIVFGSNTPHEKQVWFFSRVGNECSWDFEDNDGR